MTVFKTSLPRSEAYWGITKKSDIIDRLYLGLYKGVHAYPNKYASYTVSAWFILSVAEVSVPAFAGSLPSVHVSQKTTLRLANTSRRYPCV